MAIQFRSRVCDKHSTEMKLILFLAVLVLGEVANSAETKGGGNCVMVRGHYTGRYNNNDGTWFQFFRNRSLICLTRSLIAADLVVGCGVAPLL